jgi:Lar family restriction alleviation protein
MTMAELKPCPFCGGGAVLRRGNKDKHGYFVVCHTCGAKTAFFSDKYTSHVENKTQAIEAWNRRADNG